MTTAPATKGAGMRTNRNDHNEHAESKAQMTWKDGKHTTPATAAVLDPECNAMMVDSQAFCEAVAGKDEPTQGPIAGRRVKMGNEISRATAFATTNVSEALRLPINGGRNIAAGNSK